MKNKIFTEQSLLNTLLDNLQEGVQVIDRDWHYKYLNNSLEKRNKFKDGELIGKSMLDIYPGIQDSKLFKILARCMTKRTSFKMETAFVMPDNSTGWFELNIQPVPEGLLILSNDITKHHKSTRKLKKIDFFNTNVLSSLNFQIAVINNKGTLISVNKAWNDFGKENGSTSLKRSAVGSNYFKVCKLAILSGDTLAKKAIDGILSVFNKETPSFEMEYPCHSPQKQRWFILNAKRFESDDNYLVISHQDISALKSAQLKVHSSEIKYKRLFETTKEGILIIDATNGKILDANPFISSLLEYPYSELLGKEFWAIGLNKDIKASKNTFKKLKFKKYLRYDDLPLKSKKGKVIYVEFICNVFVIDNTKVIQCNIRDISERKINEELLQKLQINMRAVLNNTDANIYSLDKDFRYTSFNLQLYTQLKNLYGITIKIGDSVFNFHESIHSDEAIKWRLIYEKALTGEIVKFEKEFKTDAFYNCSAFSIYPIWESTAVVGLSCFVIDITKQKLESIQKEKMIVDIIQRNDALEQFTYIISHNLNGPFANIVGLIDLVKEQMKKSEENTIIKKGLTSSIGKLNEVISDLNNILQIKKLDEQNTRVQFSVVIKDILSNFETIITNIHAQINENFSLVDEVITIKSYLHSILFNLISNSIKYRRQDVKLIIEIDTYQEASNIILNYTDNGMGIDLDKKGSQVFGLYKRFHTDKADGKGIGLFMVKAQVEALGGSISIKSVVDIGTSFKITFNQ
ncbi:MAG: PAS domain S-box protein [bacterium]|nr:PAS domain S-box protein [bacterium]